MAHELLRRIALLSPPRLTQLLAGGGSSANLVFLIMGHITGGFLARFDLFAALVRLILRQCGSRFRAHDAIEGSRIKTGVAQTQLKNAHLFVRAQRPHRGAAGI